MKGGKPVLEGRHTMLHFRHAAASPWIGRHVARKKVQTWIGHSSIQVPFDTCGRQFAGAQSLHWPRTSITGRSGT